MEVQSCWKIINTLHRSNLQCTLVGSTQAMENSRIIPSLMKTTESIAMPFTEMQKTGEGECLDRSGIKNTLLGYIKFEMPVKYPSDNVNEEVV